MRPQPATVVSAPTCEVDAADAVRLDLGEVEGAVGADDDAEGLADVDGGGDAAGAVVIGGARAGDGFDEGLESVRGVVDDEAYGVRGDQREDREESHGASIGGDGASPRDPSDRAVSERVQARGVVYVVGRAASHAAVHAGDVDVVSDEFGRAVAHGDMGSAGVKASERHVHQQRLNVAGGADELTDVGSPANDFGVVDDAVGACGELFRWDLGWIQSAVLRLVLPTIQGSCGPMSQDISPNMIVLARAVGDLVEVEFAEGEDDAVDRRLRRGRGRRPDRRWAAARRPRGSRGDRRCKRLPWRRRRGRHIARRCCRGRPCRSRRGTRWAGRRGCRRNGS